MTLESPSFNPEQVTQKWRETLRNPDANISDQDLFELARDIIGLHKKQGESGGAAWQDVGLSSPSLSATIFLGHCSPPDELQYEAISVTTVLSGWGGHQDDFELRHELGDNGRYGVFWPRDEVFSILTDDLSPILEEQWVQVQLRLDQARSIATRLWEAHEQSLQQPQQAQSA